MNNRLSNKMNQHSQSLIVIMMMTIMLIYAVYRIIQIENEMLRWIIGMIVAIYFLVLLVAAFFLKKKPINNNHLLVIAIFFVAIVYMVVFLPGTVPDELTHYLCAYRWSNLFSGKNSLSMMRLEDATFIFDKISESLDSSHFMKVIENITLFAKNSTLIEWPGDLSMPSLFVANSPLAYIGSGLGIAIGRMIGFSGAATFYCGRLVNIGLFSGILYYSIKKMPYGKMAYFAIAALPMTLHVAASYSYDLLSIGLSMYFVAQVLALREQKEAVSKKEMRLCVITGILLAMSKVVYIFIVFLVLLIPKSKFASKKQACIFKGVVLGSAILTILLLQSASILTTVQNEAAVSTLDGGTLYSTQWILSHLKESLTIIIHTIYFEKDTYLLSMVGQYMGWFEIELPFVIYGFFILLLVFSFQRRKNELAATFSFTEKLTALSLMIFTFASVLFALWISYTPMGYGYVFGVQGRYFIPLLPILFLVIRHHGIEIDPRLDKGIVWLTLYWHLFTVLEIYTLAFK